MAKKKDIATLQQYVSDVMRDQDLSLRDVEEKSKRGGAIGITKSYIDKIKNGDVTNPSPDKMKALARGLGRPEEEIFDIVLGVDAVPDEFEKKLVYEAAGAENWNDDQKDRFLQAVRTIAAGIRSERVATQR